MGGDTFISMKENNEIFFLSNKGSYFNIAYWGSIPSKPELNNRKSEAPHMRLKKSYELTFGTNSTIQEEKHKSKLVEAHLHNNDTRLTLVYLGFGAFTFEMGAAKPLEKSALWDGTFKSKKISC